MLSLAYLLVALSVAAAFALGRSRATTLAGPTLAALHSRPAYHGLFSALWTGLVGFGLLIAVTIIWTRANDASLMSAIMVQNPDLKPIEADLVLSDAKAMASGNVASRDDGLRQQIAADLAAKDTTRIWGTFVISIAGVVLAAVLCLRQIDLPFRARNRAERIIRYGLLACATMAVLTTIGIVFSLIFETLRFFAMLDWRVDKFLFGTTWSPLSGVHSGEMDVSKVGAVPLFAGTLMITAIAMIVAVPIGLFAAIYLSEFAGPKVRAWGKPMLEILAGIPTVVYGFFAAITVAPALRGAGEAIGLSVASESALAAGVVMGIMIIPFISSLSDDVINSVPQSLRDGSYGLGATKAETIRQVILPAALPGIVSAVLLGVSRAIGETMIVVMAAGQGANLTANPLEAVTTVTVQIVMLITGDTEAETAAGPAFTLGFTLFCVTLLLNIIALRVVRKYREQYD